MTTPTAYYSFSFGGYVFGAGTPNPILAVDGLESLPELRVQDDNRGFNDGMFTGRDFYSGRYLTIVTNTFPSNGMSAQQNFEALQAALLPQQQGTTEMQFLLSPSDSLKIMYTRVRGRATVIDPDYTYGRIQAVWQFFCPDPRYYDNTLQSGSMTPQVPLGRTYNRVYNLVYGGGSQTNTVNVVNNGWATTYPTITINGPVINPVIGNATTGQQISINYSLTNSDVIVIDLYNKIITLNGNPARNLMGGGSQWFGAPPGTSQFTFSGTGYAIGTTAASVTWRSAYV